MRMGEEGTVGHTALHTHTHTREGEGDSNSNITSLVPTTATESSAAAGKVKEDPSDSSSPHGPTLSGLNHKLTLMHAIHRYRATIPATSCKSPVNLGLSHQWFSQTGHITPMVQVSSQWARSRHASCLLTSWSLVPPSSSSRSWVAGACLTCPCHVARITSSCSSNCRAALRTAALSSWQRRWTKRSRLERSCCAREGKGAGRLGELRV